jgi:hypothetical protein
MIPARLSILGAAEHKDHGKLDAQYKARKLEHLAESSAQKEARRPYKTTAVYWALESFIDNPSITLLCLGMAEKRFSGL